MVAINVHVRGAEDVARRLKLTRRQMAIAETMAINDASKTMQVKAAKKIGERYALTSKIIKSRIQMFRATRTREFARVIFGERPIPLSDYKHKPRKAFHDQKRKTTMQVQVRRGVWRKYLHAFKLYDKGHIYQRARQGGGRVARKPLEPLWGPSIAAIVDQVLLRYVRRIGTVALRRSLIRQYNRRAFSRARR